MTRISVLLFLVFLPGCAGYSWTEHPQATTRTAAVTSTGVTPASIGTDALRQILGWYERTDQNCNSPARPAFLCSGVMLRATVTDPSFLPWDPSPGSISTGGVSFSWLRSDNNFQQVVYGYGNGYIFYPVLDTPAGKNSNIAVLCVFPMDAGTGSRTSEQGCGPHEYDPGPSGSCDSQNIATAEQWMAHAKAQKVPYIGQCGWNMREGTWDAAAHFYQSIRTREMMPAAWWHDQNELRLATWKTGDGATLPIRAFFYLPSVAGALQYAQSDQLRYFQNYSQVVPIVGLALPATSAKKAIFTYSDADQAVAQGTSSR